jgi:hypothetical protein
VLQARLRRAGVEGDAFLLLKQELPDWTRERWQRAVKERTAEKTLTYLLRDGLQKTLKAVSGT